MKRNERQLKLHRETLRTLSERAAAQADGGFTTSVRPCCWSGYLTCGSCKVTCTTNYC